jgi:hypothetical protein
MSFSQVSDELIYKGKTYEISSIELETAASFLRRASREEMQQEDMDPTIVISCWDRQYCCVWEVRHGILYLRKVSGIYRLVDDMRIKAEWVSETIYIPRGRILFRRRRNPIRENTIAIYVEKGMVLYEDQDQVV